MIYFRSLREGRWTSRCGRFDVALDLQGVYTVRLIRGAASGPLLPKLRTLGTAATPWTARALAEEWITEHAPGEHKYHMLQVGDPRRAAALRGEW